MNKYDKLSDEKKAKWIGKSIKRCEEYVNEMEVFQKKHPGCNPKPFRFRSIVSSKELGLWLSFNGQPEKPPMNILEMFHSNMIQDPDYSELSREESKKVAEEQFKQLDSYNKELYKLNFRRAVLEYRKSIEEYFETLPEFLKPFVLPTIPKKFHAFLVSVVDKVSEELLLEEEEHEKSVHDLGKYKY